MAETPPPPLPLSEQILAWILTALGHENGPGHKGSAPSDSTIKSALRGRMISRSWDDLVDLGLRTIGVPPDQEGRDRARAVLREWDALVGSLPPARELSLAERLHALLTRWIPQVGVRLGAAAALVSARTGKHIEDCLWIAEPFERTFFGRVVHELLDRRFPEMSIEDQKGELERIVDRRTVERWFSGKTDVPQTEHLTALGELLGEGAEVFLRGARLAARLRADLRGWIDQPMLSDLAGSVAAFGRYVARALAKPDGTARLIGWFHEDFRGAQAAEAQAVLRPFLWPPMREWSPVELAERLSSAAKGSPSPALHAWALATTILIAHPRLVADACSAHGADMLTVLGAADFARYVEHQWMMRLLVHVIAEGDGGVVTDGEGRARPLRVSDSARETARRWRSSSLGFTRHSDDGVPDDDETIQMLVEVFGVDAFHTLARVADPLGELVVMLAAPVIEISLADEEILKSGALCIARARRLAEGGDRSAALNWLKHGRERGSPRSSAEAADLVAILGEIAHSVLDDGRRLRAMLRECPDGEPRDAAIDVLEAEAALVEQLLAQMIEVGNAPERTPALLGLLVVAAPLTLRVALLRDELSDTDQALESAQAVVDMIEACLEQQPAHGRGWSILALWRRCWGQKDDEAAKRAVHYGGGPFLEHEWARMIADLGLPQNAG